MCDQRPVQEQAKDTLFHQHLCEALISVKGRNINVHHHYLKKQQVEQYAFGLSHC